MKFNQLETTYVCQFNKPHNREMLMEYKNNKDRSGKVLAQYYRDIIEALKDTPAYGVSGVNKMLNDLTAKVRATLNREKSGKTSAYAHAGKLLRDIEFFGETEVKARYAGRVKLAPTLTDAELTLLEAI